MSNIVGNLMKTAYNYTDGCLSLVEKGEYQEWKGLKAEFKTRLQSANWRALSGFTFNRQDLI